MRSIIVVGLAVVPAWAQCGEQLERLVGGGGSDAFGLATALTVDRAVIGAHADAGPQFEDGRGAVYLYTRAGDDWVPEIVLRNEFGAAFDGLGRSVATSGDVVAAGAPGDDDAADGAGSVIVFRRVGGVWTQETTITAPDAGAGHGLGWSVDLDGDRLIIGAPTHDGGGTLSGAAYIYQYDGTSWVHRATLTPPDQHAFQFFGESVAIRGDRAVVGSPGDNAFDIGVGAAYVYRLSGGTWSLDQFLAPITFGTVGGFGQRVDLSDDVLAVAAPSDYDVGPHVGAVYLFERFLPDGQYQETGKLTPSGAELDEAFGISVAVDGQTVITGASFQLDGQDSESRSVYVFRREGDEWSQTGRLTASGGAGDEVFGFDLDLSGDVALVGALRKRSPGAAYIFDIGDCVSCEADMTGSSDPNSGSYGLPDGGTDSDDFFYFLDRFVQGNVNAADLTGSSDPNSPAYGVPDGVIDGSDFFYYLDRFAECAG